MEQTAQTIFTGKLEEIDPKRFVRRTVINEEVKRSVTEILHGVQERGLDFIIEEYSKKFGPGKITKENICASEEEINIAYGKITAKQLAAIRASMKRIRAFHSRQKKYLKDVVFKSSEGSVALRWIPLQRVGIYAPAGKAPLPSSVLMAAIAARIAGSTDFIVCSPMQNNGTLDPAVLVAANECGIKKVYKMGGARAVAAMACGCELFPPVQIISGPGNVYTTYAKQLVQAEGMVKVDTIAGPSEVAIIADETGNAKLIASDMLAQAEHGSNSSAVCVTTSEKLMEQVVQELEKQMDALTSNEDLRLAIRDFGAVLLARTMREAVNFVNEYTPEHVEIFTKDADAVARQIVNAGAIFIRTGEVFGDYGMSGSNHILPTSQSARFASGVSVYTFLKYQLVEKLSSKAQSQLAKVTAEFARLEKLEAHARSADNRKTKTTRKKTKEVITR